MELWDIYSSTRTSTGRCEPRGPLVIGDYHLVVNIWLMNSDGNILVTRRQHGRPWGNYWECTGGSAIAGEDSLTAALREAAEEIGITLNPEHGVLLDSVRRDRDFLDTWFWHGDFDFDSLTLQQEEVAEARAVTREQYDSMVRDCLFVPTIPNFFHLYDMRIKQKM